MPLPHLRPLGFGEILDAAFALYRRHFVRLFVLSLVPSVLMGIPTAALSRAAVVAPDADPFASLGVIAVVWLVAILGYPILYAALAHAVERALEGREVSLDDALRVGVQRYFPLLGAALLLLLVVGGVVAGLAVLVGITAAILSLGGATTAAVVAAVLGAVAVFAGYVGVFALGFAVLPTVVLEGQGPLQSIRRSVRLARGALPRVFGVVLVAVVITTLLIGAVTVIGGLFTGTLDPETAVAAPSGAFWLQQALATLAGALAHPFLTATLVVLYYDRRVRTEGLDVELATERLSAPPPHP